MDDKLLLINYSSLSNIADAIREKTGISEPFGVLDMPDAIRNIEGSGGSVEGVHYVTFMDETGTVELYKRPVADGDDCADPVERLLMDEPTKESTAQYNFTHSGWATTPGGSASSSALSAITEDKVVYAAFSSSLRYYTISYYDDDGTTLLKSESLAYGSTPSYTPTSDTKDFEAWVPTVASVTGDASYTATWKEKPTFETATWTEIGEICAAGNAEEFFSVGDRKYVDGVGYFTIVGFNHDDLADGSGKASITLSKETTTNTSLYIGARSGDKYATSTLRTKIQSQLEYFPDDVKNIIKTVSKKCVPATGSTIETIEDKLWAFARVELGENYDKGEGSAYEGLDTLDERKKANGYWLRTHYSTNRNWYLCNTSGTVTATSSGTNYIHYGFCI